MTQNDFISVTPAENERLAHLMGECGEVIQEASKILRHGYESWHPMEAHRGSNRDRIRSELIDLMIAIDMMLDGGDIRPLPNCDMEEYQLKALVKSKYMHHQNLTPLDKI